MKFNKIKILIQFQKLYYFKLVIFYEIIVLKKEFFFKMDFFFKMIDDINLSNFCKFVNYFRK